ncbi:MAG: glycosyltransferase [Candidatus Omnitrophota bacterium]
MDEILIIHASFGQGHKRAAFALQGLLGSPCRDLLDFANPLVREIYRMGYAVVSQNFPGFWQYLFSAAKKSFFTSTLDKINKLIFFSFFKYLKETKPKIIITTHFFPPSLISALKKRMGIKLISVITDLRVHPLWVNKSIDYYFVPLDETRNDLINLGVRREKIVAGIIPLREGFLKYCSQPELREKFSVDSKPCITFISSSGCKLSFLKESIQGLINDFNVFVVYGKNNKLRRYLEELNSPNVRFFSFYEEIWELFSLSSVIITKPGGLTVFEGLYKRKPFIFTHYIPGQEEQNMNLLIKYKIAKFVQNSEELIKAVYYFEKNSSRLYENYPLEVKDASKSFNNLIQAKIT